VVDLLLSDFINSALFPLSRTKPLTDQTSPIKAEVNTRQDQGLLHGDAHLRVVICSRIG
jgi:hypothetical protein